jgi:hypothetical protein
MLEDRYPEALGVECAWPADWAALLDIPRPDEEQSARVVISNETDGQ